MENHYFDISKTGLIENFERRHTVSNPEQVDPRGWKHMSGDRYNFAPRAAAGHLQGAAGQVDIARVVIANLVAETNELIVHGAARPQRLELGRGGRDNRSVVIKQGELEARLP